jgi:hypothetical protein
MTVVIIPLLKDHERSFIATAKSPCLGCFYESNDKNYDPCDSCKKPSQYDDRICKGPKFFSNTSANLTRAADDKTFLSTNQERRNKRAKDLGYTDDIDFIRGELGKKTPRDRMASMLCVSKSWIHSKIKSMKLAE